MTKITHFDPQTEEEFEIVRDPDGSGGWLQDEMDASYSDLVSAFGDPSYLGEGGKVQAEWCLKINGVMCTVYDWKEYGKPVGKVRNWHIGGTVPAAARLVRGALSAWRSSQKV